MDKKFDVAQALRVITKIIDQGEKKDGEYYLHGLYASEGFDGYRVNLRDDIVKLDVDFHNTYNLTSFSIIRFFFRIFFFCGAC